MTILKSIGRLWWMPLIRGIMLIILGGYALFNPGMTAAVFVKVFGFFVIAEGVVSILAAIMGKTPSRMWTAARGALAIIVGLVIFGNSAVVAGVTATMLLYVIATFIVFAGILEIIAAMKDSQSVNHQTGWMLFAGISMIAFGVLVFVAPLSFGAFIVRIIGVGAMINGASLISMAFRLRQLAKL